MKRHAILWAAGAVLAVPAALVSGSAFAQQPAPTPGAASLDRFIQASGPVCEREPSSRCVDTGFRYADMDRDGRLSVPELQRVRDTLSEWTAWRENDLSQEDMARIALGVMIVDSMGVPGMVESYDQNQDGALTKQELLADVKLDQRPLGEVLADSNNVDRARFQQRLGMMGALTDNVFPQGQ